MDVILLERIEKLGTIGDVVKVKNGYARNFLLPRGKALRANDANRKVFDANREKIEAQNAERRTDAEKDSKKVDGLKIQLIRQASNTGQLYGSVSARDLAEAMEAAGHKVAKHQIVLDRPIKAIGVQDVKIALHPESVGHHPRQRRPLARRGRVAGAGRRRDVRDVREGRRRLHRGAGRARSSRARFSPSRPSRPSRPKPPRRARKAKRPNRPEPDVVSKGRRQLL
jgi:ribosomal protein L9